jgi:ATP-binding cassette subfamily F protein uup
LLEQLLQDYAGTVFLVSHDRRFVDNVVTSTLVWEGDVKPGLWREYEGNIEDWQAQRARSRAATQPAAPVPAPAAPTAAPATPASAAAAPKPRTKLSYKEQRELEELPARIEALEAEQKTLGDALAGTALYAEAPQRIAEVHQRFSQIEEELMVLLERWEALGAR